MPEGARDLATGSPDTALLPSLDGRCARSRRRTRSYGGEPMLPELAAVAGAALAADGVPAGRLCVVNGALDGIERVLAAHLSPGDVVAVEDPGWPGVHDLARALGLRLEGVAVDARGMRPRALAAAQAAGARAVVLTPRGHNPLRRGAGRRAGGRAALGAERLVLVVEDDHLGPVAGTPWHTLVEPGRERWAAVRSVSKWLGPDLRLAVLAGDDTTLARVEGRQSLGPGWVTGIVQRLVARLWSDDEVMAVVARASSVYAERRAALAALLGAAGAAERHQPVGAGRRRGLRGRRPAVRGLGGRRRPAVPADRRRRDPHHHRHASESRKPRRWRTPCGAPPPRPGARAPPDERQLRLGREARIYQFRVVGNARYTRLIRPRDTGASVL